LVIVTIDVFIRFAEPSTLLTRCEERLAMPTTTKPRWLVFFSAETLPVE
jgi:hypothetical protein